MSKPSIIFVKQPEQIIDEALKSQIKKKKVEDPFDYTILENLKPVEIAQNFRKFVPLQLFEKQSEEYYQIDSGLVEQKFKRYLDGTAHIIVEVRNDEGFIQNNETKDKAIRINLFNEDSYHFAGYHYACLFLEEGEEAYFIFDDGYTSPFCFAKTLLSYETNIQIQSTNKIYKIKLEKLKLQYKKREFKEGYEITQEDRVIIRQEEIEGMKLEYQNLLDKKNDITEKLFKEEKFVEAFRKYSKLELNTLNVINKYAKNIEETQEDMINLKSLKTLISSNKIVSAVRSNLFQQAYDGAIEILAVDPKNQKMLYTQAKCLFKLSYFDKALDKLQEYIKMFPEDERNKSVFDEYIKYCQKKLEISQKNQVRNYQNIFDNMEEEEQKENIRRLNQQSIEDNLKKEKEVIISQIFNENGFQFNTESDLIQNLDDNLQEDI